MKCEICNKPMAEDHSLSCNVISINSITWTVCYKCKLKVMGNIFKLIESMMDKEIINE